MTRFWGTLQLLVKIGWGHKFLKIVVYITVSYYFL